MYVQKMQVHSKKQPTKSPARTANKPQAKTSTNQTASISKAAAPVVDTRTPEEIDAAYNAALAAFEKAEADFVDAFERKIEQFKSAYGQEATEELV